MKSIIKAVVVCFLTFEFIAIWMVRLVFFPLGLYFIWDGMGNPSLGPLPTYGNEFDFVIGGCMIGAALSKEPPWRNEYIRTLIGIACALCLAVVCVGIFFVCGYHLSKFLHVPMIVGCGLEVAIYVGLCVAYEKLRDGYKSRRATQDKSSDLLTD
jgi:hypothetical protein